MRQCERDQGEEGDELNERRWCRYEWRGVRGLEGNHGPAWYVEEQRRGGTSVGNVGTGGVVLQAQTRGSGCLS